MVKQSGADISPTPSDPSKIYSFATHLNVLFDGLKKFDVLQLAAKVKDQWFSQSLCKLNDSPVRMGVVQGTYHWQKNETRDELFFCLNGEFWLDLEGTTISLQPYQGVVVPKGVVHRPRAPEKCIVLLIGPTIASAL